ncbi:MAG: S-adenosylmethionine:tRNA ribosyltransferase-isomerase [Chitinophagales bacterium]
MQNVSIFVVHKIATVGRKKMHPKHLSIKEYTYSLPDNRIAKYPFPERDASKLLIYQQGKITEDIYRNLASQLPENALLIFNDSKVVEARLLFQKPTGGIIEIFCLEPHEKYGNISAALQQKGKVTWQCFIGGASKWKHGQLLEKKIKADDKEIMLLASYIEKKADSFLIELSWFPADLNFAEVLHHAGAIPLPPYIKREVEKNDAERYQTIYAHFDGSVAAPTAGLHFTKTIFENLKAKNIHKDFVTLHVGAGTFKPVNCEVIEGHEMHAEFINVSRATIENILENLNNNIISVGTTSLRTIESLYWLGVKTKLDPSIDPSSLTLLQWEAYDLAKENILPEESLRSLLHWMSMNQLSRLLSKTQIIIAPGYKVKIIKALITNFHQPQSTLLLLVAALIGEDWKKVYAYALENDFRFLSYGDGCLLWSS